MRLSFRQRVKRSHLPHIYFKAGNWRWVLPDDRDALLSKARAIYIEAWVNDRGVNARSL